METLSLVLDGMGCGGCVKNARKALDALPGVAVENVAVGSAVLAFDPARSSKQAVVEALVKAGYPAREAASSPVAATNITKKGGHCGIAS